MKKAVLSRRDFLKGAFGIAGMAAVAALPTVAKADAEKIYTPGTYTASARGLNADVTVTMTFDETSIVDVVVDASGETPEIGGAAASKLVEQVLAGQTAEIDGVSGASYTSDAVRKAATECIAQAKGIDISVLASEPVTSDNPSWLKAPEEVDESKIVETIEKEVVVIGCGPAGYYTAASCAENGLETVIVAKGESYNAFGGTHFVFNSDFQKETGHTLIDFNTAVNDFLGMQGHKCNEKIVWTYANRSGEAMNWLVGLMADYGLYPTLCDYNNLPLVGTYPGGHTFYGGPNTPVDVSDNDPYTGDLGLGYVPQVDVGNAMMSVLDKLGVDRYFNHTCVRLNREGTDGPVTSIVVKNKDGNYKKFVGTKAVVICAGSYGANKEMVEHFCPTIKMGGENVIVFDPNDGSVDQQAVWIGASMQKNEDHAPMLFCGDAHPVWDVLVNKEGFRYMEEGIGTSYTTGSTMMQTGAKGYAIWCEEYANQLKPVKADIIGGADITPEMLRNKWDSLVDAGVFVKSESLDEVAEFLGLPAEQLKATIEKYNADVANGEDTEFHKNKENLFPITAPYYGGPMGCACLAVVAGLHVDEMSRVLQADNVAIPHLYAVGLAAGDFWANTYTTRFPGNSLGHCLTFGYLLGRQLAGVE